MVKNRFGRGVNSSNFDFGEANGLAGRNRSFADRHGSFLACSSGGAGLVIILVIFGPPFVWGLGLLLAPKSQAGERILGLIFVSGIAAILLWGLSLVM